MGNLTQLIELYEAKGVKEVLKEERLWENLEELKAELGAEDPEIREKLETRFQALLEDLARNMQGITKEMQESADRMDSSKKNTEACLSYTKTSAGYKSGREKG